MMNKTMVALLAVLVSTGVFAQSNPEKYAATITEQSLRSQLTIVAGPAMEGRETATEGQKKAAAYIAGQFSAFGLKPAPGTNNFQQQFPLFYDSITKVELSLKGKKLEFGKDYIASSQNNDTRKVKGKKLVFAGYGISDSTYDDYAGKDVKDKIVVIFAGEPKKNDTYMVSGTTRPSRWSFPGTAPKVAVALQKGATAVLVISPTTPEFKPENTAAASKTSMYYPKANGAAPNTLNAITLSHATAANLLGSTFAGLLEKAKTAQPLNNVDLSVKNKLAFNFEKAKLPLFSSNVVGVVEGSDKKDEYVVLTGHYDHLGKRGEVIFNGADDDGSGTVSVIEMARAFAQAKAEGNGPRRSMVFMTVSGEEKGLWGSRYYSENPLFPLDKTSVNLNTDMVGRLDPSRKYGDSTNYVYVIGEDKLSTDLPTITDEANNKFVHLELDRKFNANDPNRFYYRSDHYNFAKMGVPIIFYFNGTHADYHRATDTINKINFDVMTKRVHLVYHTAWIMANRDEMLKRDIPLK